MSFLWFIKNIIQQFKAFLYNNYVLAKYQTKYGSSKFYSSIKLDHVIFGDFNVVFYNVSIGNSIIGSHTYIQKNSTIFNANIGKYCSIASNVSIGPGIHKTNGLSTHPAFYLQDTPLQIRYVGTDKFTPFKRTIIEHDVWIGEKAIIIDGVTIGTGAIIAAGSVVTKNVRPYEIVGGAPAKVIKKRFDDEVIEKLLKSKWWDQPEDWIEKNHENIL